MNSPEGRECKQVKIYAFSSDLLISRPPLLKLPGLLLPGNTLTDLPRVASLSCSSQLDKKINQEIRSEDWEGKDPLENDKPHLSTVAVLIRRPGLRNSSRIGSIAGLVSSQSQVPINRGHRTSRGGDKWGFLS